VRVSSRRRCSASIGDRSCLSTAWPPFTSALRIDSRAPSVTRSRVRPVRADAVPPHHPCRRHTSRQGSRSRVVQSTFDCSRRRPASPRWAPPVTSGAAAASRRGRAHQEVQGNLRARPGPEGSATMAAQADHPTQLEVRFIAAPLVGARSTSPTSRVSYPRGGTRMRRTPRACRGRRSPPWGDRGERAQHTGSSESSRSTIAPTAAHRAAAGIVCRIADETDQLDLGPVAGLPGPPSPWLPGLPPLPGSLGRRRQAIGGGAATGGWAGRVRDVSREAGGGRPVGFGGRRMVHTYATGRWDATGRRRRAAEGSRRARRCRVRGTPVARIVKGCGHRQMATARSENNFVSWEHEPRGDGCGIGDHGGQPA
jgi:hypothetical protein